MPDTYTEVKSQALTLLNVCRDPFLMITWKKCPAYSFAWYVTVLI